MPKHRLCLPIALYRGVRQLAPTALRLFLDYARTRGPYTRHADPLPEHPTPTEKAMATIHLLVGPQHTAQELTTGHFLKATDAVHFAFQAHGLTPSDVGAAPTAQGVLNGNTHDHVGGDGADILQTGPSTTPTMIGYYGAAAGNILTPHVDRVSILKSAVRCIFRVYYSTTAALTLNAPSGASPTDVASITTSVGHLNLAPTANLGIATAAPAQKLHVTGNARVSGTYYADSFISTGFVKNSSAGMLSGGNTIITADIPADIGLPLSDGFPLARWRGVAIADPTADLNNGDFYLNSLTSKLCVYSAATSWARCTFTA
jgi:hypothetical protein